MHACDSSSGSARVLAHIRTAHSAWAARLTVGESSCERHHVEPRRRFLPWPPRLVSATRWGAAEAEACASRARDQQAAWEGAHTPRRPRRSEASRQVIHGSRLDLLRRRAGRQPHHAAHLQLRAGGVRAALPLRGRLPPLHPAVAALHRVGGSGLSIDLRLVSNWSRHGRPADGNPLRTILMADREEPTRREEHLLAASRAVDFNSSALAAIALELAHQACDFTPGARRPWVNTTPHTATGRASGQAVAAGAGSAGSAEERARPRRHGR